MNANQSNLSTSQYGYDFVVATTQASINAAMKEFMSTLKEPEVILCYVADQNGNPSEISYDELKKIANGSDPFAIPDNADPDTNQDLINLFHARFMVGFKAQIGLPSGVAPLNLPDIVTLGTDTSSVSYNLMCAEFIVVQYTPSSGYNKASWMNKSQPSDAPWLFNSKVDLRLSATDPDAYKNLPVAVQKQIGYMGGYSFSVQQLLFDLDNAGLETVPEISGVTPGTTLYTCLQTNFLGKYFTTLQKSGKPMLGATITQTGSDPSTLVLSEFNLNVNPFMGTNGQAVAYPTSAQQNLSTLNYLCAANGNRLPPAVRFPWNWVDDKTEEADFDGVISINRDTFTNYFKSQLYDFVKQNCYQAWVRVTLEGVFKDTPKYEWSLTPGQIPTISVPPTGANVLNFSYSSSAGDTAGLNGDIGQMDLNPSYQVSVNFSGNAITIVQHLIIDLRIQSLQTSERANVVDVVITDTYTLTIDSYGNLKAVLNSQKNDQSSIPQANGFLNFFTGINDLTNSVGAWLQNVTATNLKDIPVSVAQKFVFPGGKTFAFKDAFFSDNQDLVTHITYTAPPSK